MASGRPARKPSAPPRPGAGAASVGPRRPDAETCNPLVVAYDAGRRLNALDWHLQQAWLLPALNLNNEAGQHARSVSDTLAPLGLALRPALPPEAGDRRLFRQVAPGGGLREREMVPDEPVERGDAGFVDADATSELHGSLGADDGVVALHPLPEIVEKRGEEQQVGAGATRHVAVEAVVVEQRRALGDRFEQVAVDGEAVVRVALR